MNWENRFWQKVKIAGEDDCWQWLGGKIGKGGYGVIKANGCVMVATHASLLIAGKPRPFRKAYALHSCDNPSCVNPKHLRWGTQTDNMLDRKIRGRSDAPRGSKHHASKLTEQDVLKIRKSNKTNVELAEEYNVKLWTLCKARRGISWKHV